MATPPNPDNLQIPKGVVTFDDGTGARDLGEVSDFTVSNSISKKDYFSSREGIRKKIKSVITEQNVTCKLKIDEPVGENLAFFALSDIDTDTEGNIVLKGLSKTQFEGTLKIVGTNDVGPKIDWEGTVSFTPSGDFKFIEPGDEWNGIEVEAEVLADEDGNFGTWTVHPAESEA